MTANHGPFQQLLRRPMLVLIVFTLRTVLAIGLSWSWAKLVAPEIVMAHPNRDHELSAPGASLLLRIVAEQEHTLLQLARIYALFGVVLIFIGSIISAIVLVALVDSKETKWPIGMRKSVRVIPSIIGIAITHWLFLAAIIYFSLFMYPLIPAVVYPFAGEHGSDTALALLVAIAIFGLL